MAVFDKATKQVSYREVTLDRDERGLNSISRCGTTGSGTMRSPSFQPFCTDNANGKMRGGWQANESVGVAVVHWVRLPRFSERC